MDTIVVSYVNSPEGEAALAAATGHALKEGARLVLVTTSAGQAHVDPRHVEDEQLRAVGRQLTEQGVPHTLVAKSSGDPADDVLEVVNRMEATLVVIGLRRRTPLGKFIMGSNAQRILLDCPCPVLCVKAAPTST